MNLSLILGIVAFIVILSLILGIVRWFNKPKVEREKTLQQENRNKFLAERRQDLKNRFARIKLFKNKQANKESTQVEDRKDSNRPSSH